MKVQLPWLNKAAGRSVGTVYQSYWGATYTRSMPTLFHYADTEKQQRTQAIFFDLQRIWIPIYKVLSVSISKQQRKNKNPFNMLSHFIYKIFQPYSLDKKEKYPSNFGLDPLNRVRPFIQVPAVLVSTEYVTAQFDMNRPFVDIDVTIDKTNIILFNITSQSMYYMQTDITAGSQRHYFKNVNDWKPTDEIVMYISLSGPFWLGNFNLIAL